MRQFLLLAIAIPLLCACGIPTTANDFDKTPEARFLRGVVDRVRSRDFASLEPQLESPQADARAALERIASALPPGSITRVQPVGWNVSKQVNGPRVVGLAAEYEFASSEWFVMSAELVGEAEAFRIRGFHIEPLPAAMSVVHGFTLSNKGAMHYAFLLLAPAAAGVSLFAFVRCLRMRGLRRKWMWALVTLVGAGAFTLNWTTGAVTVNPLTFNLLSAAFARAGWVGPWAITFCIPIGAIVFLWKHRRRTQGGVPAAETA
ncbi:MAG TPA: hypothetical protein VF169_13145 [Albitalea sp.]|uniref:hypothetical protein n=1 Tax=Piscinibacter sp. TaxID=1903157 RepID=UPI002ED4E260